MKYIASEDEKIRYSYSSLYDKGEISDRDRDRKRYFNNGKMGFIYTRKVNEYKVGLCVTATGNKGQGIKVQIAFGCNTGEEVSINDLTEEFFFYNLNKKNKIEQFLKYMDEIDNGERVNECQQYLNYLLNDFGGGALAGALQTANGKIAIRELLTLFKHMGDMGQALTTVSLAMNKTPMLTYTHDRWLAYFATHLKILNVDTHSPRDYYLPLRVLYGPSAKEKKPFDGIICYEKVLTFVMKILN